VTSNIGMPEPNARLESLDWGKRPMVAKTVWKKEMEFEGLSESGHTIAFDAGAAHANGPSPMEAVLLALCSCTSVDVVSILQKKREPLTSLTVSATAEQSAAPLRVFTRIK
jgi:putative redox protein